MRLLAVLSTLLLLTAADTWGEGAVRVKDIAPGTSSSFPTLLTAVDASLYFSVGGDLWVSQGLTSNTTLIRPATDPTTIVYSPVTSMVSGGKLLYFIVNVQADTAHLLFDVAQLWKTDGTVAGTTMVKNITPGGEGNLTDGEQMVYAGGKVYFNGVDSQNGRELWVSDGTEAGTHITKDINLGSVLNAPPEQLTVVNDLVYFVADDGVHGQQIWKSNGTTAGTTLVSLLYAPPSNLTPKGDNVYFSVNPSILTGEDSAIGVTDGTMAGTELIAGFTFPSELLELANAGGKIYFTVQATSGGLLFTTDGTFSGTSLLLGPFTSGTDFPNPLRLTNFQGKLYFVANDGINGFELWKSSGTVGTTTIVKDIFSGGDSYPQCLTPAGDLLFFAAYTGTKGSELYQSDGSSPGTKLVSDINTGFGDSNPSQLTNVKGTLYFTANDGDTGVELWRFGTPNATAPAAELGNISTRVNVGVGDNVMIGGFIITGTEPKKVVLRGIGPSLPVPGALANPYLELHDSTGAIVAANDDWGNSANKQAIIDSGVPPTDPKEAAVVRTLDPGNYTAVVRGVNNATGVGLVEVYDLDQTVDAKLANISTRGLVQSDDDVMIGGLIVLGTSPTQALLRAIGPSLPVGNALADPTLELHDSNGAIIASNDDWKDTQEAAIEATTIPPTKNAESAIVVTLSPGTYTAVVRGKNNSTGVALVEAYQLGE